MARRDYTQQELTFKLQAKHYSSTEVEEILAQLIASDLLSDARYAENFIRKRQHQGYGPERVEMELRARGIAQETIAELLKITDNAWFDEARRVWQKHFKNQQPHDFKTKAKQMRYLQYRGFTRDQIERVFSDT